MNITDKSLLETIQHNKKVFVKFSTSWCAPCRAMDPIIKKVLEENRDILYISVDAEDRKDLAEQFEIKSVPSSFLYIDGKLVNEKTGAMPMTELKTFLQIS